MPSIEYAKLHLVRSIVLGFNKAKFCLEIDRDFRRNIPLVIGDVERAMVSGFQLLEEEYAFRIGDTVREELTGRTDTFSVGFFLEL